MDRFVGILVLVLFSSAVNAASNKWIDADGNVVYSDTVPPDVKSVTVRSNVGKGQEGAPATYSQKSYTERDAELKKAKQEKEEAAGKQAKEQSATDEKRRNCAASRENVRTLEEGGRIVTYGADGERAYLDDDARAQRLQQARNAVSANCN